MNGFKIIRVGDTSVSQIICEHGMIDSNPKLKYRVEKKNAFDPTYIHRRFPYHEDSFNLSMAISPEQYQELIFILNEDGVFYLFYEAAGELKQYPVTIDSLPKCPDDLNEYTAETSFTLISRYLEYTPVVDPEIEEMTAFDETLIIEA